MASWLKVTNVGSPPLANSVAVAIANRPQSFTPTCFSPTSTLTCEPDPNSVDMSCNIPWSTDVYNCGDWTNLYANYLFCSSLCSSPRSYLDCSACVHAHPFLVNCSVLPILLYFFFLVGFFRIYIWCSLFPAFSSLTLGCYSFSILFPAIFWLLLKTITVNIQLYLVL